MLLFLAMDGESLLWTESRRSPGYLAPFGSSCPVCGERRFSVGSSCNCVVSRFLGGGGGGYMGFLLHTLSPNLFLYSSPQELEIVCSLTARSGRLT